MLDVLKKEAEIPSPVSELTETPLRVFRKTSMKKKVLDIPSRPFIYNFWFSLAFSSLTPDGLHLTHKLSLWRESCLNLISSLLRLSLPWIVSVFPNIWLFFFFNIIESNFKKTYLCNVIWWYCQRHLVVWV